MCILIAGEAVGSYPTENNESSLCPPCKSLQRVRRHRTDDISVRRVQLLKVSCHDQWKSPEMHRVLQYVKQVTSISIYKRTRGARVREVCSTKAKARENARQEYEEEEEKEWDSKRQAPSKRLWGSRFVRSKDLSSQCLSSRSCLFISSVWIHTFSLFRRLILHMDLSERSFGSIVISRVSSWGSRCTSLISKVQSDPLIRQLVHGEICFAKPWLLFFSDNTKIELSFYQD